MDIEARVEPVDEPRYRGWELVGVWAFVFASGAAIWSGVGYLISLLLP